MELRMSGRTLSTAALSGLLLASAGMASCRDSATTGPSQIASSEFASNLRLISGDVQVGAVASALPQVLTVRVVDAGGEPVEGAAVTWSVMGGAGSVNPPTGVSNTAGLVNTVWTLGTSLGDQRVRAYLMKGYVLDSVTFSATATNGAPETITIDASTTPPATALAGAQTAPISFVVGDRFGYAVPGATVRFNATGGGSANPDSAVSDANGRVATVWTMGTSVGSQTLTATLLAGQAPIVLNTTTTPDTSTATRIVTIDGGDNQAALVSTQLPQPLRVRVTDRFNNPIAGDIVVFSDSLGSGDQVTPSTAVTNTSGIATTTLSLGPRVGQHIVRVTTLSGKTVRFTSTGQVTFRDVFAGNFYACGVTTNDRAYCWGFGENGQLGLGQIAAVPTMSRNAPSWPVTQSDTLGGPYPTFREIAGGRSHSCGVTIARGLMCWGFNPDSRAFSATLQQVNAVLIQSVSSVRTVSTGESFTCVTHLGGAPECSGTNESGELNAEPAPVSGYAFIVAGERHGCGFAKRGGADTSRARVPLCWGLNGSGQLGNGTTDNKLVPDSVKMPAGVAGFDSTSLVAGAAHTCALTPAGEAYCWGSNEFGQLGAGMPFTRDTVPRAVDMSEAVAFSRLYAGEYHTCGLTAQGEAFCWGRNDFGQLDGSVSNRVAVPKRVPGGQFQNLALGERFTCGIRFGITPRVIAFGSLGDPGTVQCWGNNAFGQLGTGVFGGASSGEVQHQRPPSP
jgi:alpha-tubulin suppressor-like RCC1 family protein